MSNRRGLTITFAPNGLNNVGNQEVGNAHCLDTYPEEEILKIYHEMLFFGYDVEIVDLGSKLPAAYGSFPAYVLIIRDGLSLFHIEKEEIWKELSSLPYDRQARMYGRICHKRARYNLIFADFDQKADHQRGEGTVVNFKHLPCLTHLRQYLPMLLGAKAQNLVAEANDYFDVKKCGIGYHGDKERKMVIGLRLGAVFPLCFYWYRYDQRISKRIDLQLQEGDIYLMSSKAVGYDSYYKKAPTLRHAAGCHKYVA